MIGSNPLGEYLNVAQAQRPYPGSDTPGQAPEPVQSPWQQAQVKAPQPAWGKATVGKGKKQSAIDKYLSHDSDYLRTIRDLARSMADYQSRQKVERTRVKADYGYAQKTAGDQKTQDLGNIADDFAARGIVRSGVYGQKVGDYNTQFGKQQGELTRQYNNQLTDFTSGYNDFLRQQQLQKETARDAAIRRRAAKLGL